MAQQCEVNNLWVRQDWSNGSKCTCSPQDRVRCYKTILAKERRATSAEVEEMVRRGIPRHQARQVAMDQAREKARLRVEKIVESNENHCFLSFRLNEAEKTVSVLYQTVVDRLLESDPLGSSRKLVTELVELSADEFQRVLKEGVVLIGGDAVRRFFVQNTTPLMSAIGRYL